MYGNAQRQNRQSRQTVFFFSFLLDNKKLWARTNRFSFIALNLLFSCSSFLLLFWFSALLNAALVFYASFKHSAIAEMHKNYSKRSQRYDTLFERRMSFLCVRVCVCDSRARSFRIDQAKSRGRNAFIGKSLIVLQLPRKYRKTEIKYKRRRQYKFIWGIQCDYNLMIHWYCIQTFFALFCLALALV